MYKIYKHEKGFLAVEILNPTEILPDFNFNSLEKELRECVDSQLNISIFFNSEVPNCETKFWKLSEETETIENRDFYKIVEMNQEEKDEVLLEEDKLAVNQYFRDKKYKVSIGNLARFIDAGFEKFVVYVDSEPTIIVEKIRNSELGITEGFAYMDKIFGEDNPDDMTQHWWIINNVTYPQGDKVFKLEINKYKEKNLEVIIE